MPEAESAVKEVDRSLSLQRYARGEKVIRVRYVQEILTALTGNVVVL